MNKGLMGALRQCQEWTSQDQCEHAILLDFNGERLFEAHGDHESVQTPMMLGAILVHSHPVECPLSLPDIMNGLVTQSPIYAITPRGWVSWITGKHGPGLPMSPEQFFDIGKQALRSFEYGLAQTPMLGLPTDRQIDENEPRSMEKLGLAAHLTNILLSGGKRMFDYRFTMPPAEVERLDKDTRLLSAGRVRSEIASWATHASFEKGVS